MQYDIIAWVFFSLLFNIIHWNIHCYKMHPNWSWVINKRGTLETNIAKCEKIQQLFRVTCSTLMLTCFSLMKTLVTLFWPETTLACICVSWCLFTKLSFFLSIHWPALIFTVIVLSYPIMLGIFHNVQVIYDIILLCVSHNANFFFIKQHSFYC